MMNNRWFNRSGVVGILALLAVLLLACQPIRADLAQSQTTALSEEEAFTQVALGLEEAYQQGDLERTIAYYADDAISSPPGFPTSRGKDAIRADYQAFFEAYELKRDFTLSGIKIEGNTATRFGEWKQVITPRDGSDPITETGRCIVGFEKINGEWKVTWELWNTFEPPVQ